MNTYNHFNSYFENLSESLKRIDIQQIERATESLLACYQRGGTVYIFGNGGSAANASHIAGDYSKAISLGLDKRFKIMALNDNIASMMAYANDLSYDYIFIEPLKTFLTANDLVIAISGSGNSTNVLKATEYAKEMGVEIIGISGFKGGKLNQLVNIKLHIPVDDMEMTEDANLILFHAIKQQLIRQIKGENSSMGDIYDMRVC